uniref:Secreted protein n=1 Tax=Achlya hypogyna TaxID=1202772 RepID=A0A0A7CLQ9_ACHHY|nr:secreted protein [Achlya hypogyna]
MAIAVCLLLSMVALFVYSYKTQPCIGSGRTPNNIRALTFSSTIYTNICVVVFLFDPAPHDGLYYSLLPLPLVWLAAWRLNDRRAALVHIPDLPIVDLLHEPSTSANVVGAIAALYVDAAKVRPNEHEAIVSQLAKFARSGSMEDPLSRIYAIRTLWYCHIENFRKSKRFIGEQADDAALSHKLWLKDRMNPDRPPSHLAHQRGSRNQTRTSEEKRIKIFRVEDIHAPVDDRHGSILRKPDTSRLLGKKSNELKRSATAAQSNASRTSFNWQVVPSILGRKALSMPRPELTEYHVIQIRGKNWISKVETPEAAVAHFERLYQYSLEVLSQSRAAADPVAMREMALFLLQGYKASANLDGLIPAILWLRQSSLVNQLAAALGHPSASTVTKCALTLASILEKAEGVVNIYVLLTPETMSALHRAFHRWNRLYRVSDALERLYLALHAIEKQHFQHTLQNRAKKASIQVLSMIAATGARVRRSIVAVMAGPIGSLSTEVAKRKSWLVSAPIPVPAPAPGTAFGALRNARFQLFRGSSSTVHHSSRVAADIRSRRGHFNPSVTSPRAEATIDTPYDRGKCHLNPGNSRDSRVDAQAAFYSIHEASRAPFDATSSPRNSPFLTATDAGASDGSSSRTQIVYQ